MVQTVYVCHGKKCGKRSQRRDALVGKLEKVASVERCGCMRICSGPVVGLEVDGSMEWFKKVDSDGAVKGLRRLVRAGKLSKALDKRRVDKCSGRMPRVKKR